MAFDSCGSNLLADIALWIELAGPQGHHNQQPPIQTCTGCDATLSVRRKKWINCDFPYAMTRGLLTVVKPTSWSMFHVSIYFFPFRPEQRQ